MTKALIHYYIDYNNKANTKCKKTTYQINTGGTHFYQKVLVSFGESIEFFCDGGYEHLEEVRNAIPGGLTAEKRFKELKKNLQGVALIHFQDLGNACYPNPARYRIMYGLR